MISGVVAKGSEFQVNTSTVGDQYLPSVTGLVGGGYIVARSAPDQAGPSDDVYGQLYGANGDAVGSEFLINTFTDGIQTTPSVAALEDGGFVVTWEGFGGDIEGFVDILAQRFDAGGTPLGAEFRVNTFAPEIQASSSVISPTGGGFIVTWTSSDQDGSNTGIYGQQYDENGAPVGTEFQDNSFTDSYQTYSDVTAMADDDLLKGGRGNDIIEGGGGDDELYGSSDDDRFVFGFDDGSNNVIMDFQDDSDLIDLSEFNFATTAEALSHFYEIGSGLDDVVGFNYGNT